MPKPQIKSIFGEISETIFKTKCLNQAKECLISFAKNRNINEKDKQSILKEVEEAKSLTRLQQYIANALLKYEGLGINQLRKTAREAASEDANFC